MSIHLLLGLLAWVGCSRSTQPDTKPLTKKQPASQQVIDKHVSEDPADTVSAVPVTASPVAVQNNTADASTRDASTSDIDPDSPPAAVLAIAESDPDSNPLPDTETPFRLLLPTQAGLLLVDLEISIDAVPLVEAFVARVDAVLSEADADKNQTTTWNEFLDHLASDADQFGRGIADNRGNRRGMIQMHDRNRNGNVESDEAVNVLFRNSNFDTPFRLQGTDYYRGRKADSPLFRAIDLDQSGGLSEFEIDQATESLSRRDRNTDQRIDLSEIIDPFDAEDDPAWNRRRSNRNGTVATDLQGYVDWSMMSYSVDDLRQSRPFGLRFNPIDHLDENDDGMVSKLEIKSIRQCDPDLIVSAALSQRPGGETHLSIRWVRSELQPFVQRSPLPNIIALADTSLSLSISLTDRSRNQNQIPAAAFAMLDSNADGALDETEIPEPFKQEYSLEDYDTDGDGKLTLAEINEGMAGTLPIWNVQMQGRGAEFPDAMFAYLDTDFNRVLSTREIGAAPTKLRRLNSSGSEELHAEDLPESFDVQIVRGDPQQPDQLYRWRRPRAKETLDEANAPPRWARRMDVNVDGEISVTEFVGSIEQFRQLDTNEDGFIGMTEAHSAELTK
jgi:Ca2+-binding EF-hand superfamily protein